MRFRSNSASAPKTWKMSFPVLVVVSMFSCRERRSVRREVSAPSPLDYARWGETRSVESPSGLVP
ncbi:MAG: hypothetical protein A2V77_15195 [Anaeromyxobacter sp. RBG_16_69_14]|nr:MAG: hypothetical protein A2V77_15195 [Anaeromyxobacter sp. RBG_16_69_14]